MRRDDPTETVGDVVEEVTALDVQTGDRGTFDGEGSDLFVTVLIGTDTSGRAISASAHHW